MAVAGAALSSARACTCTSRIDGLVFDSVAGQYKHKLDLPKFMYQHILRVKNGICTVHKQSAFGKALAKLQLHSPGPAQLVLS